MANLAKVTPFSDLERASGLGLKRLTGRAKLSLTNSTKLPGILSN
ncbi:hypothetical protein COLO4_16325 [Corchorus olitorius]|uniref:Uncharacterized protein n=1 Tax=Corchorus olitorius TaxID=93759 RepID=A0A1R3JI00_9ROSI|nr:hypothetical protein COLO4_16325 [Corchorus olitorius]